LFINSEHYYQTLSTTQVFIINNIMTYFKSLISLSLSELSAKKIKEQQTTMYKVQTQIK